MSENESDKKTIDEWCAIRDVLADLPGDGTVAEKVKAMKDERDRFQKLAIFYDEQIRAYVETYMENDGSDDGRPMYCGKSPTLWLKELRNERAARAAAEKGGEWNG